MLILEQLMFLKVNYHWNQIKEALEESELCSIGILSSQPLPQLAVMFGKSIVAGQVWTVLQYIIIAT